MKFGSCTLLAFAGLLGVAQPATAATFTFVQTIGFPRPNNSIGEATVYPVAFDVQGLSGRITDVSLTLVGFTHSYLRDLNMVLSSPGGQNLTLMRHNGTGSGGVNNATITFDDAGRAQSYFSAISGTTWRPSGGTPINIMQLPSGTRTSTFAAFDGGNPNGSWGFRVYDSQPGDDGFIREVRLSITTDAVAAVPEPASWAMMIGGFGIVGGAMRRRRRMSHTVYA